MRRAVDRARDRHGHGNPRTPAGFIAIQATQRHVTESSGMVVEIGACSTNRPLFAIGISAAVHQPRSASHDRLVESASSG